MTARAVYVESSILGRAFAHRDPEAHAALHENSRGHQVYSSVITVVEARRALVRAAHQQRLAEAELRGARLYLARALNRLELIGLTDEIVTRAAELFPVEYVTTLDALHLATALALAERYRDLVLLTRDHRVRENALALGLRVV